MNGLCELGRKKSKPGQVREEKVQGKGLALVDVRVLDSSRLLFEKDSTSHGNRAVNRQPSFRTEDS